MFQHKFQQFSAKSDCHKDGCEKRKKGFQYAYYLALAVVMACMCSGCAHTFVQGNIRIALPVVAESDESGQCWLVWSDGGTTRLRIIDAAGRRFDVYADRRILNSTAGGMAQEPGTIYINGYPGSSNSVRIIEQDRFVRSVLKGIVWPVDWLGGRKVSDVDSYVLPPENPCGSKTHPRAECNED